MKSSSLILRHDEMPIVGRMLLISLERDWTVFVEYSPDFNDDYKAGYITVLVKVEGLVNPKTLLAEQKKLTSNLYETMDSLRPILKRLEGYVDRAGAGLTILPGDFGFKEVRDKIQGREQEGLRGKLVILFQNVDNNIDILTEKGWTEEAYNELKAKYNAINTMNLEQKEIMNRKSKLVEDNIDDFKALEAMMQDIMKTGKILFEDVSEEKYNEYNLTHIKGKIRHERRKKETEGDENIEGDGFEEEDNDVLID